MKRNAFVLLLLFCSHLAFSQIQEGALNHILNHTSIKKSYAILFKNNDSKVNFIWSNNLLDYYKNRIGNKTRALKTLKGKLLTGDSINITPNYETPIGLIDTNKVNQLSIDINRGLQPFIDKYFEKNQLKPIYVDLVKEISFCLWQKQTYLFIGLDSGTLPSIGIMKNKIVKPLKVKNNIADNNSIGVEFYFPKYDYYLKAQEIDTTLVYLKLKSKQTDIQRISPNLYEGMYDYAKFSIDKKQRCITVDLYDDMKNFKQKEIYKYDDIKKVQEETNFYNLTSTTKIIKHKVIVPMLLN